MMKRWQVMLLAFSLLLFTGCAAKETPPEAPQVEAEPPVAAETVPKAAYFSYEEVLPVFNQTEESLIAQFGAPQSRRDFTAGGLAAVEMVYEAMTVRLADFGDGVPSLYEAILTTDDLAAPREITLGMKLADVLARFPADSDESFELATEDEGASAMGRLRFGAFEQLSSYGYLRYPAADAETAEAFVLSDEGVTLEIQLADERVSGYRYFMALN